MKVAWYWEAWEQYVAWSDPAVVRRINALIADIARNGNTGIGKPERLRYDLAGFWSRRINQEHRLVYRIVDDRIEILSCRSHYRDR